MGAAKLKREAFYRAHPLCCFCGGGAAATTEEHCPSKSTFQDKVWPEGFTFPSCAECNAGSSDSDVMIAVLGRMSAAVPNAGWADGHTLGLMRNARRQFGDDFWARAKPSPDISPTPVEARTALPFGSPFIEVSNLDERAGNAEAKLYRRS